MNNFELFKNRLNNGKPFTKERAMERINNMLLRLEITEAEGDELMAIVEAKGCKVLPDDAFARIEHIEVEHKELAKWR